MSSIYCMDEENTCIYQLSTSTCNWTTNKIHHATDHLVHGIIERLMLLVTDSCLCVVILASSRTNTTCKGCSLLFTK